MEKEILQIDERSVNEGEAVDGKNKKEIYIDGYKIWNFNWLKRLEKLLYGNRD